MKVNNTTEEAMNNPIIGLLSAMNIKGQEMNGQSQLIKSTQMPSRIGSRENGSAFMQYEKMGIKVISITKGDEIFCDVELPIGWKKRCTNHSMWNELIDDKGRIRATLFYKASFYDREAFINFNRRFSFNIISYLPQDQTGHYEKQTVKIHNPNYIDNNNLRDGEYIQMDNDGYKCIVYTDDRGLTCREPIGYRQKYISEERDIWIPKFKNEYQKRNNTPHYLEVTDCDKLIFTTKNEPIYFKTKYTKNNHEKWWNDYELVSEKLRMKAINYLNESYPDFESINAYWD